MGLAVKDVMGIIDAMTPFGLAEDWDNSGLQAGELLWPVTKIMVSLDVTMAVMEAAKVWEADMVLSHHPLMFKPEKTIDFGKMPGSAIAAAARNRISIVSAHTNLDKAPGGLNDAFAHLIGLTQITGFCPDPGLGQAIQDPGGFGRIGKFPKKASLKTLARDLKKRLGLDGIRVIGNLEQDVLWGAVCTGSGGSLIPQFLDSKADVFITGDLKYHDARLIEEKGKTAVDAGHFVSEHMAVDLLKQQLEQSAAIRENGLKIKGFLNQEDPFKNV